MQKAKDIETHTQDIIGEHMKNYKSNSEYYNGLNNKSKMQGKLISYLRTDGTKGKLPTNKIMKGTKINSKWNIK